MKLSWFESLISWDLCPQLIRTRLERVVSNGLRFAVFGKELDWLGTDLLSIVESIVSCSTFGVVNVGPVLV
jgi:hypothetical protein